MRLLQVPVVLAFIDDHGNHLSESVVEMFKDTLDLGVKGSSATFLSAKKLVDQTREL